MIGGSDTVRVGADVQDISLRGRRHNGLDFIVGLFICNKDDPVQGTYGFNNLFHSPTDFGPSSAKGSGTFDVLF